jgi:hypothetical protein
MPNTIQIKIRRTYYSLTEQDLIATTKELLNGNARKAYDALEKEKQLNIANNIYLLTDGHLRLLKILELPLYFDYVLQQTYFNSFRCYLQRLSYSYYNLKTEATSWRYNYYLVDMENNVIFELKDTFRANPQKLRRRLNKSIKQNKNILYETIEKESLEREKTERLIKIENLKTRQKIINEILMELNIKDEPLIINQEVLQASPSDTLNNCPNASSNASFNATEGVPLNATLKGF